SVGVAVSAGVVVSVSVVVAVSVGTPVMVSVGVPVMVGVAVPVSSGHGGQVSSGHGGQVSFPSPSLSTKTLTVWKTGGVSGVWSLLTSCTETLCMPSVTFSNVWDVFVVEMVSLPRVPTMAGTPGSVGTGTSM